MTVHIDLDPYRYGPAGVAEQYSQNVDPMWLYTPAPYGPLMLQIQHLIVDIAGPLHPYAAAVAMRIPALLGVVLIGTLYPLVAEAFGARVSVGPPYFNPMTALFVLDEAEQAQQEAQK